MTISDLRKDGLILLECISGSKAYGLDTPQSDTDIKGVFIYPKNKFYGLDYVEQVSNETNDVVFYELGRFMELLSVNNPNILELLNSPQGSILYKHPILNEIDSSKIISKLCVNTFGKFALSQLRKARGLKKKIVNPIDKKRKNILSFCYINYNNGSIPLANYLELKNWDQENCGLVRIPNMVNVYGLYHSVQHQLNGILRTENATEICLSSIPKSLKQEALLYFNQNGYSSYCKEYKEYWEWVNKRNEIRYQTTQNHGKSYDSKNMMHVFRLLEMAIEIGQENQVNVERSNRAFLLQIKSGFYEFDELMEMANDRQNKMEFSFQNSTLRDQPDLDYIEELTFKIRDYFYSKH